MRIDTAVNWVKEIYEKAKDDPMIRKPVSYSLYQAWMWASSMERERKLNEEE